MIGCNGFVGVKLLHDLTLKKQLAYPRGKKTLSAPLKKGMYDFTLASFGGLYRPSYFWTFC